MTEEGLHKEVYTLTGPIAFTNALDLYLQNQGTSLLEAMHLKNESQLIGDVLIHPVIGFSSKNSITEGKDSPRAMAYHYYSGDKKDGWKIQMRKKKLFKGP
jgi:hypothetical protein